MEESKDPRKVTQFKLSDEDLLLIVLFLEFTEQAIAKEAIELQERLTAKVLRHLEAEDDTVLRKSLEKKGWLRDDFMKILGFDD